MLEPGGPCKIIGIGVGTSTGWRRSVKNVLRITKEYLVEKCDGVVPWITESPSQSPGVENKRFW